MGGTHEVGRNAVLLESGEKNILLDYGVKLGDKIEFPGHVRSRDVDGIVLTHAHLDHSGGIPLFYLSEPKPFFATSLTTEIMKILIKDMIKLSGYFLPFEYIEFDSMLSQRKDLAYGQRVRIGDIEFALTNAGHIQGSAMVELKARGKRVLYTGDINTQNTRLVHGAKVPGQRFDAVVIESTYAKQITRIGGRSRPPSSRPSRRSSRTAGRSSSRPSPSGGARRCSVSSTPTGWTRTP